MPNKTLAVVSPNNCPPQVPDPTMAAKLHQCVLAAGAISAASAIVCGLQLLADQAALKAARKKSASTCTFDEWLETNAAKLGFARRTAFNYLGAAKDTKAKLLKGKDPAILRLLDDAPANLSVHSRTRLMEAVQKCIGVQTLMDIYLDAGIVKESHGHALNKAARGSGGNEPPSVTTAEKVQMQLDLFGKFSLALDDTVEEGGTKILLISKWPKPKLDDAIRIAKHNLALLVKVRGGIK